MNAQTCEVLAQLFPLLLIAIVIEARFASRARHDWQAFYLGLAVASCVGGMVACVIGVANTGLGTFVAALVWFGFGIAVLVTLIAIAQIILITAEE